MTQIAKEYAEALFSLATETQSEQTVGEALGLVARCFADNPDYAVLLSSPRLSREEREALLVRAFGAAVPETVLSFVCLLCRAGHIDRLADCTAEYASLYRLRSRTVRADIVSAVPLTEAEKSALLQRLQKKSGCTVTPVYAVDPALLGGLVVRMGDTLIDGSLRQRLKEMKEVIEA